jgi:hypothetical protein
MIYQGIRYNPDYNFKMVIGDGFKGIIRTLKVLNWPKLEMHFKGNYLPEDDCKRYANEKPCDVCSPEYRDGTCFPNCELDESPSIMDDTCAICLPDVLCMHCDDSGGAQFCTKCRSGSFRTSQGCTPCYPKCKECRGLEYFDCVSCYDGFEVWFGNCIETCGDGKNYGEYQCDDGNINDGDG